MKYNPTPIACPPLFLLVSPGGAKAIEAGVNLLELVEFSHKL